MTDIIQKLRGLIAKATDGPWMAAASPSSIVGWPIVGQQGSSVASVTWMPKPPNVSDDDYAEFVGKCEANAKLIEAMRNHLPALLDRLEAAEARFVDLEYRSAATEVRLREWDAWFDRATAEDDCEYLNGAGWSDATVIREVKP